MPRGRLLRASLCISTGTASFLLFGMMNWLYTWYDPAHDADPQVVSAAVKEIFLHGYLK